MIKTGENMVTNNRELKLHLEDRIPDIISLLKKGQDVEIRTDPKTGVRIIGVKKEVVKKEVSHNACK